MVDITEPVNMAIAAAFFLSFVLHLARRFL